MPSDLAVEVKVTEISGATCSNCWKNSIEIKSKDPRASEPRVCCEKYNNQVYVSTLNPLPIILRFTETPAKYTIQYRTVKPYSPCRKAPYPVDTKKGRCLDAEPSICLRANCANLSNFPDLKKYCAKTCGLCGKAAPNCKDMTNGCNKDFCNAQPDPFFVERFCAATCGYCQNPN